MTESHATPWKLGILLSGAGRTLENLLVAIEGGDLNATVAVAIGSVAEARGLEVAKTAGIPHCVVARGSFGSLEDFSAATYAALDPHHVDLIAMAGYLRKILVWPEWEGRILNIHPCLLPEAGVYAAGKGMFGERVHAAVIANGDSVTGATVHVVTNDYDAGPPLARVDVPVIPGDTPVTLGNRVFQAEKALYPATIQTYMNQHPELKGRVEYSV